MAHNQIVGPLNGRVYPTMLGHPTHRLGHPHRLNPPIRGRHREIKTTRLRHPLTVQLPFAIGLTPRFNHQPFGVVMRQQPTGHVLG